MSLATYLEDEVEDIGVLERVFSDADVIDIDLGRWAERVDLTVLSDHYRDHSDGVPIVRVRFGRVSVFDVRIPKGEAERVWHVYRSNIEVVEERVFVRLSGMQSSPVLVVEAEDFEVVEEKKEEIDRRYPGWAKRRSFLRSV